MNHDATFFIKRLRQLSSKVHTRKFRDVGTRGAGGRMPPSRFCQISYLTGDRLCTSHYITTRPHGFLDLPRSLSKMILGRHD